MLYDIWPNAKLPEGKSLSDSVENLTETIEHICMDFLDCTCEMVLFPSARSAIYHIFLINGLKRNDSVCISEWSSHCVIEAIGRLAMPKVNLIDTTTKGILINHQWGYTKKLSRGGYRGIQIEDSCDSLLKSKEALFPNGSDFEIFSFPKILGSLAGGACVCRSKESASLLREARKERSRLLAEMQCDFKSRYISEKEQLWLEYYGGVEAINGWLTKEELGQIMDIFKDMDDIFRKRESRCRVLQEESLINICGDRLPVAVPLKYSKELEDALLQNDFELPVRHFNFSEDAYNTCFKECIVFPIHQDVCEDAFHGILSILKSLKRKFWGERVV